MCHYVMEFQQTCDPKVEKPIMIAAMQDMGDVGSIVMNFINRSLRTKPFRDIKLEYPSYVIDKRGYIEAPLEKWEYRYTEDMILFGGGRGQPQRGDELNTVCQDVIDVAKKHSVKLIYTVGGMRTDRVSQGLPKTYVTATARHLTEQIHDIGIESAPQKSIIIGFNGVILGYAKINGIHGIGVYGELNDPGKPQYRTAISIIKTLEKLTYRKIGNTSSLELMAQRVDKRFGDSSR